MLNDRPRKFLCYYGSKIRAARHYPTPLFGRIIEPFAGGAGYSVLHFRNKVSLYDISQDVISAWNYLINRRDDIPFLSNSFQHLDELHYCGGAKSLISFNLNAGSGGPAKTRSAWARKNQGQYWSDCFKSRIFEDASKISHWSADCSNYLDIPIPDAEITWFIDPPYPKAVIHYKYSKIDYNELSEWIKGLKGQVIVCGEKGDAWFNFDRSFSIRTSGSKKSKGYSNEVYAELRQ